MKTIESALMEPGTTAPAPDPQAELAATRIEPTVMPTEQTITTS